MQGSIDHQRLQDGAKYDPGGLMEEKIDWLKEWFGQKVHIGSIRGVEHINYLERRLIDSVAVIELIVAAEERFNIGFSSEAFDDPRFATISGLAEIIGELEQSL